MSVDARSGEAETFERSRGIRILKTGLRSKQFFKRIGEPLVLRASRIRDGCKRAVAFDPAFDEFRDESSVADRLAPAVHVKSREQARTGSCTAKLHSPHARLGCV